MFNLVATGFHSLPPQIVMECQQQVVPLHWLLPAYSCSVPLGSLNANHLQDVQE